ncbi:MAG: xanthine dehydrogenase [Deltaproteobacteria bacterium]|nr:xanthine dehydrogenase [Deltaproteobacteria bacterium]
MAILNLSRREFLQASGILGTGLLLGWRASAAGLRNGAAVSPLVHIGSDGGVTLFVERAEMGQGVHSGLAQLVAEELEIDWSRVRVENRALDGGRPGVTTGGSSSVRQEWEPMQRAGAAAREMLVRAASLTWKAPPEECRASGGEVVHGPSSRRLGYGELAARASELPVPQSLELKPAHERHLIGRSVTRLDLPAKVDGTARYGMDVKVEGMLYAVPSMSPVFGGELVSADTAAALARPGVRHVVEIPNGLAVVADHYWQARKGLEALQPRFAGGDTEFDSRGYSLRMRKALDTPGVPVFEQGNVEEAFAGARVVEARYEVPYLAQACMEPMNCTASVAKDRCEVWAPTQGPGRLRDAVAEAVGLPVQGITVHTTLMGGGFGRRFEPDFAIQAALASQAVGRPVKLIWSREDDTRHAYYRPACAAELRAALDADGRPRGLSQHVAGPWPRRGLPGWLRAWVGDLEKELGGPLVPDFVPRAISSRLPPLLTRGVAGIVAGGGPPTGYSIPTQRSEYSLADSGVPIGWWRSVAASQLAFFTECFVDELAAATGSDPYAYRHALASPKQRRVLEAAAALSDWRRPLPAGRGRGMALYSSFGTTVCQVVELASAGDSISVEHVYCTVDCGQVLNPDSVEAQMEGSILFGLTAALRGEITLRDGQVEQGNFHDYPLLGLAEAPQITVELLEGEGPPQGIGEPGTPPIAPAVTNALYAATGRRIRTLPLERHLREPSSG